VQVVFVNQDKTKASHIRKKMLDYKRFAITLLCVGAFFYLGSLIPSEGKTMFDTYGYLGVTIAFLIMSIGFFAASSKINKKLSDMDDAL
jgi:FtsH-binding integral membrane protein